MGKKVLIVTDRPTDTSGVANQAKQVCKKLVQSGYEVVCVGMALKQPSPPYTHKFDSGESIKIYETAPMATKTGQQVHQGHDDINTITQVFKAEKPDCLVLFQDPNKFFRILPLLYTFRQKVPLYFIHVWDTYLTEQPDSRTHHYNLPIYENFDGIGCISKQTECFVNTVFNKLEHGQKPLVHYIGHGSDPDVYKPVPISECAITQNRMLNGKSFDFVATLVNRNQGRKKLADLIEAWRLFREGLTKEQASRVALYLHTDTCLPGGYNLPALCDALAPNSNIHHSPEKLPEAVMNHIYNVTDVVINCSNAEGFGLTTNEAMLAGTPILANATGGLVDQIGFMQDGKPVEWTFENKSRLKEFGHGAWALPLHPQRTIIGDPELTFYLYDENASIDDLAAGIRYWYELPKETRKAYGLEGRQWCLSQGLNSQAFSSKVFEGIRQTMDNFKPQERFTIYTL